MKKNAATAGVFASFTLIVIYFALYIHNDARAWWISLLAGSVLFILLFLCFFLAGLIRAARYDAYEKAMPVPYRERFVLSFREKGGLHTDARLYILEDGWLFVALTAKKKYEKNIRPEEVENFDLSGEDIEIYLHSGELLLVETGEKEKLAPYFEAAHGAEESRTLTV